MTWGFAFCPDTEYEVFAIVLRKVLKVSVRPRRPKERGLRDLGTSKSVPRCEGATSSRGCLKIARRLFVSEQMPQPHTLIQRARSFVRHSDKCCGVGHRNVTDREVATSSASHIHSIEQSVAEKVTILRTRANGEGSTHGIKKRKGIWRMPIPMLLCYVTFYSGVVFPPGNQVRMARVRHHG